jgi:hypothetical protein
MAVMSELGDDFKLSFRSTGEVYEAFGSIVARAAADRSIRFAAGKKKANRAAVLNALILWLDGLPPAEQKDIIRAGMVRLNAILGAAPEPPAVSSGRGVPDVADGHPARKNPNRKRA